MKITHLGHACVLVEVPWPGGNSSRVLLDPGTYSTGFEQLTGLDAILITHQHADHLDPQRLPALLEANPSATLVADAGSAEQLAGLGVAVQTASTGEELTLGGVSVSVIGVDHATIHPDIPIVPNNGYLIAGSLLHPGDAFVPVDRPVPTLLLPTGAPWMKVAESIDYLRAVRPDLAVPIHQGGLAPIHQELHYGLFRRLGPAGTTVEVLDEGAAFDV